MASLWQGRTDGNQASSVSISEYSSRLGLLDLDCSISQFTRHLDVILSNDGPSNDAEGVKPLQSRFGMTEPNIIPPTAAESGKPGDRNPKEGCEIVFTMPKARDVVRRFSAGGACEGATALGTFTREDDAVEAPLKAPLR